MKRKILIPGIIFVLIALVVMGIFGCQRKSISVLIREESNSIQTEKKTSAETSGLSSCVIFDEEYCKYCKEGELLTCDKFSEIGFDLPVGTKVYSLFDGILDISYYTDGSKGIVVTMWPPKEVMHTFCFEGIIPNPSIEKELRQYRDRGLLKLRSEKIIGIIMTEDCPEISFYKVEKGEFIGEVSDDYPSSMLNEMYDGHNGYNLVIKAYSTRDLPPYSPKDSPEDFSSLYVDMDFIKQYFPNVEEKVEK